MLSHCLHLFTCMHTSVHTYSSIYLHESSGEKEKGSKGTQAFLLKEIKYFLNFSVC